MLADGSRINGLGSFTVNGVSRALADAALAFDAVGFRREAVARSPPVMTHN